jgi:hypothetical protein
MRGYIENIKAEFEPILAEYWSKQIMRKRSVFVRVRLIGKAEGRQSSARTGTSGPMTARRTSSPGRRSTSWTER